MNLEQNLKTTTAYWRGLEKGLGESLQRGQMRAKMDSCDLGLLIPMSAAGYWLDWLRQEMGRVWVK